MSIVPPIRTDTKMFLRSDSGILNRKRFRLAIVTEDSDFGAGKEYTVDVYGSTFDSLDTPPGPVYEDAKAGGFFAVDHFYNGELCALTREFPGGPWELHKLIGSPLESIFKPGEVAVRPLGQHDPSLPALAYPDPLSTKFWYWDGAFEFIDFVAIGDEIAFLSSHEGKVSFGFLPILHAFPFVRGDVPLHTIHVAAASDLEVSFSAVYPDLSPIIFHDFLFKPSSAFISLTWFWWDGANPSGETDKFLLNTWIADDDTDEAPGHHEYKLTSVATSGAEEEIPDQTLGYDKTIVSEGFAISQYTIQKQLVALNAPARGVPAGFKQVVWWGVKEAGGVEDVWRYDAGGGPFENLGWGTDFPKLDQVLATVFSSSGWAPTSGLATSENGTGSVVFS